MGSGPALVLWFGGVRDALSEVTKSIRLFRTCGTRSAVRTVVRVPFTACINILNLLNLFLIGD